MSEPENASVLVNGLYAGTAPFAAFLPEGLHEITFRRPGFTESGELIEIKGYVFASLFKKPEVIINKTLDLSSHRELFEWALDDIIRWGMIEDFHNAYQPEKLISKTIEALPDGGKSNSLTEDFLLLSLKNINREYFLGDLIRGYFSYKTSGKAVLPGNIIDALSYSAGFSAKNRNILFHLVRLTGNNADRIFNNFNSRKFLSDFFTGSTGLSGRSEAAVRSVTHPLTGSVYLYLPGGKYLTGNKDYKYSAQVQSTYLDSPPFLSDIENFYISEQMVTNREYYSFVRENSFWNKSNIDQLIERGLVTKDYLDDWIDDFPTASLMSSPVRFVSFYSAEAYCEWLNKKDLPGIFSRYHYVLPDEYMREAAENSGYSLSSGVLWEWCFNWFNESDYIDSGKSTSLKGIEKAVRGGSWANNPMNISPWTRGSQPPYWCTPFTGFRTALAEKNNGSR